jgi:cell division septation protein DedD
MATRDGELFKDKIEVSLDGRQIFCLFCGGAVIASLVFVLGVMVGRRVEARGNPERAAAGTPASDPLAALDQFAAQGDSDADTATDAQLPSALREGQAAPPTPVDVSLAHPAPAPAAAPKPQPEPEPKAEPVKPEPPKAEPPKPEPKVVAAPPAKPVEPPKAEPPKGDGKGRFTLQLSSFQTRGEADAFIAELKKSGYAPTVTEANVPGKGTWFRVRLGGYSSYDEAMAGKAEFESKAKIIAYVTRVK